MIEPFFLDDGDPRLLITYHPPAGAFTDQLTVICPPFFNEYLRVQLALRELAIALSEAGQHVVRFDYRATGDSFGNPGDATLQNWSTDLERTVREAREISGCTLVNILAVRGGALVAADVAEKIEGTRRLVLWDPVLDGSAYADSMQAVQTESYAKNVWFDSEPYESLDEQYLGYTLGTDFETELRTRDAESAAERLGRADCRVVATPGFHAPNDWRARTETVSFDCNWVSDVDAVLMPQPVLEKLKSCLLTS